MALVNGHLHWTFGQHLYRWHAVRGGGKSEGEGEDRRGRQLGGRAGGERTESGEERRSAEEVGGPGREGVASGGGAGVESGGEGLWEWEVGDWRSSRVIRIMAHDPVTGLQFTDFQLLSPTLAPNTGEPVTPGPMLLARQPVVLLTCPPNAHFLPPSQPKSAGAGVGEGEGEQVAAWVAGGEIRALVFSLPPILNVSAIVYREREPGGILGGILGGMFGVGGKGSSVQGVRVELRGESGAEGLREASSAGSSMGSGKEIEMEIVEEVVLTREGPEGEEEQGREEAETGGNEEDGNRRPSPLFWAAWDASRYARPPFSPSSRLWLAVRVSYHTPPLPPPHDASAASAEETLLGAAAAAAARGVSIYTSPPQPFTAFNCPVPFQHTWLERTIMGTDWEDLWVFAIASPLLFLALILLGSRALSYLIPPPSSQFSPSFYSPPSSHSSHSSHTNHATHAPSSHSPSTTPATVRQPPHSTSHFTSPSPSPPPYHPPSTFSLQTISSSLLTLVKSLPSALLALLRLLLHIFLAASYTSAWPLSLLLLLYLSIFPWFWARPLGPACAVGSLSIYGWAVPPCEPIPPPSSSSSSSSTSSFPSLSNSPLTSNLAVPDIVTTVEPFLVFVTLPAFLVLPLLLFLRSALLSPCGPHTLVGWEGQEEVAAEGHEVWGRVLVGGEGDEGAAVGYGLWVAHPSMAGGGSACTRGCCGPSALPRVSPGESESVYRVLWGRFELCRAWQVVAALALVAAAAPLPTLVYLRVSLSRFIGLCGRGLSSAGSGQEGRGDRRQQ
ncbi:unnamed protein product [Closterium sp. Naga37s-1]|nr:unnamed protein product [Closterium sp. Naga37s-1]